MPDPRRDRSTSTNFGLGEGGKLLRVYALVDNIGALRAVTCAKIAEDAATAISETGLRIAPGWRITPATLTWDAKEPE